MRTELFELGLTEPLAKLLVPVPPMSRVMADVLARQLSTDTRIASVELFGSVATHGEGQDIDLVITADEPAPSRFMTLMSQLSSCAYWYGNEIKSRRLQIVEQSLPGLLKRVSSVRRDVDLTRIDMFLFPSDWKKRPQEIQRQLRTWDQNFVARVAASAVLLYQR